MVARFYLGTGYFGRAPGNFGELATARVKKEEKQGTMIVPFDPCGHSAPSPAGVAVPDSGWPG